MEDDRKKEVLMMQAVAMITKLNLEDMIEVYELLKDKLIKYEENK